MATKTLGLLCACLLAAGVVSGSAPRVTLSTQVTGSVHRYTVGQGDALVSLSARFGTEVRLIASANGLDERRPLAAGTTLVIDNRHVVPAVTAGLTVVVNIPQRFLFAREGGGTISGYPVAVGRPDWPTPVGVFRIVSKEEDPVWDVPVSIHEEMLREGRPVITRMPPGPCNPLGRYWIGLSVPALGLHGTTSPESVYRAATHGCIRLHADDIERLFSWLPLGATGELVYRPVLVAMTPDGIFVEAHRDIYRRGRPTAADVRAAVAAAGADAAVDWRAVADVLRRSDGVARDVSLP